MPMKPFDKLPTEKNAGSPPINGPWEPAAKPRRPPQSAAESAELLVLGHVCRDVIGTQHRLGGAAAFAARAAGCLGVRTAVVTAAPPHFFLLRPLWQDPLITLCRASCVQETVFALDYSGPSRRIHLLQRAADIHFSHIPLRHRAAPVAYVAPVIGECQGTVVAALASPHIIVGAQGWLRGVNADGLVVPKVTDEFLHPPSNVSVMIFSELDHPDAEALAEHVAGRQVTVALTRGAAGATVFMRGKRHHIEACPADEVDPTGAGDVFGVVFGICLHRGASPLEAAQQAAYAAARVVEGPGLGNLRDTALQRLSG